MPTSTAFAAPMDACDSHGHVFDPAHRPATAPAYPLPEAPAALHRAMRQTIGVTRAVLVQPSAYGSDHDVLLAAIAASGGTLRGVGLLDTDATNEQFDALDAGGVRALRFVEARVPGTGARYPGNVAIDALDTLRAAMTKRGWHAEIWAPLGCAADICDAHAGRGLPIVLDHMAGATAATSVSDPAVQRILRHLERGDVWVKLVLCRTAASPTNYAALRPLHEAFVAANPDRVLWGTDFPFIRKGDESPDAGALLDLFAEWTPDPALRQAILVANPAALYHFDQP